ISSTQFRSKFDDDIHSMHGTTGIGVISDYEDQPLIIGSHLGTYAIATVGAVRNIEPLVHDAFRARTVHFSEMSGNEVNQTELIAMLINQEESFAAGIARAHELIEGSCSILLLTDKGMIAARDRLGRTPVIVGQSQTGYAVTMESCALPNLGLEHVRDLGPGEAVLLTPDGIEQLLPAGDNMQMCTFLWIYYGYPASSYEGINVEQARYRCGAALARADEIEADAVAGIPDSGTAHAIGYAVESGLPYTRPFVKYTPTWPRSFMPQIQSVRDLVAKMKLIPIRDLTRDKRLMFCEDSIVRGTQLRDTIRRVFEYGAREVHMRPACPPLVYGCQYLNFSRSTSEMDLAARRAIVEIEGTNEPDLAPFTDESSDKYHAMVERIGTKLGLTSLTYQKLPDMVKAIGLPKCKLCTYCWDGCRGC
ncbi:MAG: amidophosphoribosyltransferase, partial [Chitinivibrionales bacterium]|nr:amidophosphoribosyltransferase [Chitinivibrionales bacterium]